MINTAITMYGMMMCCSMSLGHGAHETIDAASSAPIPLEISLVII